jgi:hypothetical protein
MAPVVKISLHDVPNGHSMVRLMHQGAAELAAHFPSILSFHLGAEKIADPERRQVSFQVHVELLFAQHQVVFNRVASTPKAALDEAMAAATIEIERLARRDPSVAPAPPAIRTVRPLPLAA